MRVQEAIELLQRDIDIPGSVDIMDVNQAEELLIEAGKELNAIRNVLRGLGNSLLSGETEE